MKTAVDNLFINEAGVKVDWIDTGVVAPAACCGADPHGAFVCARKGANHYHCKEVCSLYSNEFLTDYDVITTPQSGHNNNSRAFATTTTYYYYCFSSCSTYFCTNL